MEKGFYTYILRCADGTLYTGWTVDPEERLRAHNEGRGARYTRSRLPAEMIYCREFSDRHSAMAEEVRIKKLTRAEKLALAEEGGGARPVNVQS